VVCSLFVFAVGASDRLFNINTALYDIITYLHNTVKCVNTNDQLVVFCLKTVQGVCCIIS